MRLVEVGAKTNLIKLSWNVVGRSDFIRLIAQLLRNLRYLPFRDWTPT